MGNPEDLRLQNARKQAALLVTEAHKVPIYLSRTPDVAGVRRTLQHLRDCAANIEGELALLEKAKEFRG